MSWPGSGLCALGGSSESPEEKDSLAGLSDTRAPLPRPLPLALLPPALLPAGRLFT